ncbi:MAG TPA: acyltransferase family protein [Candidatus Corynebacterium avicola]|uniref:Acyltransferase family protein n=1 Tax=Candidatus Corynebacterium avicola TaxID=2838527 RepID=A0A9D1RNE9_9CORY|nr:acyltransferase family protein [Candidatus Corynebacterium avicola]
MQTRDYRLDKAKGLLIALVVLGHFLERMGGWGLDSSRALLTAFYSFHMPAFILLAGITAKSNKLLDRILVFVVLLVTAQPIYRYWVTWVDTKPDTDLIEPYWITWFLLAMVWWFLLLPLVERFPKTMLTLSIAIGVFGGVLSEVDYALSIGRAMTFFPFFVIGKLYGMRMLRWAGGLSIPKKLGLSVLSVLPIVAFFVNEMHHRWLYGAQGFEFFDVSVPLGAAIRVCLLGSALMTTIALLSWSQHLPGFLIVVGQRSLAIYLLHGLVVWGVDDPLNNFRDAFGEVPAVLACIVASAVLTAVLSWGRFDWAIRTYSTILSGWIATALRAPFPERGLRPKSDGADTHQRDAQNADDRGEQPHHRPVLHMRRGDVRPTPVGAVPERGVREGVPADPQAPHRGDHVDHQGGGHTS